VRILVVDDHQAVRDGVRSLFVATPGTEVIGASSAQEGLSLYRSNVPDVVLIDLNLPDMSGFELLDHVLLEDKAAKVIVFSAHASPIYASRTFEAGGMGYVSKAASTQEVIDAVNTVAAGRRYIEHEIEVRMAP
jgi:two-component system, NarL family, invasion response regulator UvrY